MGVKMGIRSKTNPFVLGSEAQGRDSLGVFDWFPTFDSGVGSYSDISFYSTSILPIALLISHTG